MAAVITTTVIAHGLLCGPNGYPAPRHRSNRKPHAEIRDTARVTATPTTQLGIHPPLLCARRYGRRSFTQYARRSFAIQPGVIPGRHQFGTLTIAGERHP